MTPDRKPLEIESSLDLLIALLYAKGEKGELGEAINGITRLQKLLFLLRQGIGPKAVVEAAMTFDFEPYKMGPFSRELYRDLDILASLGMLTTSRLEYHISDDSYPEMYDEDGSPSRVVESIQYRLNERGMEAGEDLLLGMANQDGEDLDQFKAFFGSLPLQELLIFVYRKYEEFTSKSEIKGQLGL